MKKIVFLPAFVSFFLFCELSGAQILRGKEASKYISGAKMVRIDKNTGKPKFIKLDSNSKIKKDAFQKWIMQALQLSSEETFKPFKTSTDQLGFIHIKYRLYYQDIPVEGCIYIAHFDQNGNLSSCNGFYPAIAPITATADLTKEEALSLALETLKTEKYMWEIEAEEKELKRIKNDSNATYYPKGALVYAPYNGFFKSNDYRLSYKFDIYSKTPLNRVFVYVDAATGEIIWELNNMPDSDVTGIALTKYSGTRTIITDSIAPDTFRLRETGRGGGIETYNMLQDTDSAGIAAAVDFLDNDNFWNNVNINQDEVATDTHWGSEMTYDFFWNTFGRNSYDDSGTVMLCYIHYGNKWSNARWDGLRSLYGDGDGVTFSSFASLDVIGHEFTHGVTRSSADLVYQDEPGALNESFSDIFGTGVEFYGKPDSANYLLAEDIYINGGALRNMSNPNQFDDPDTYLGDFWAFGSTDNGGVHTNSGVQNYWFYLLAEGGSGVNDLGNSFSVNGLGLDTALQIAYRNLMVYLTPSSEYADARFYSVESATDLFGICSPQVTETENAWYAVGVGLPADTAVIASFNTNITFTCSFTDTIIFINLSAGADEYVWDFGDGTTDTIENPTYSYSSPGLYVIELTANGLGPCVFGTDITTLSYLIAEDIGAPLTPICTPATINNCCGIGIANVTLNNINNSTNDGSDGYQDYSCISNAILIVGDTYDISVNTGPSFVQHVRVWIDYNNDGVFNDSSELAFSSNSIKGEHKGTISSSLSTVLNIPLRMRVIGDWLGNNNITSCDDVQKGQAEDYALIFIDSVYIPPTGLDQNLSSRASLSVYPNPSNSLFHVNYSFASQSPGSGLSNSIKLSITNLLGRVVYTDKMYPNLNSGNNIRKYSAIIDPGNLPKGLFFLIIDDGERKFVKKLIVE